MHKYLFFNIILFQCTSTNNSVNHINEILYSENFISQFTKQWCQDTNIFMNTHSWKSCNNFHHFLHCLQECGVGWLSSLSQYQFISILSVISKLISNKVNDHLNRNNLLSDKQYGFHFSRFTANILSLQRESVRHLKLNP